MNEDTALKPGDVVWAYAYESSDRLRGRKLRQKPVKGMLLHTSYPDVEPDPAQPPRYFVPIGRNGKPSWSRIANAGARKYALTEQEAVERYNLAVKKEIAWLQEQVRDMTGDLIDVLEAEKDEDGDCRNTVPFRADLSVSAQEVLEAIKDDLVPLKDNCGEPMTWDEFATAVRVGGITDYDGQGDLIIDGRASSNDLLWIATEMLYIYDRFMIPFERVPEIFEGHEIGVLWFNK